MAFSWEEGSRPCFIFQDDLGPSASNVTLQFVSESDTQMIVHVQRLSSSSRTNLLAPARPVAVQARPVAAPAGPAVAPAVPPAAPARSAAAPGHNFVWRNFSGHLRKPNWRKTMLQILQLNTSTFLLIRMSFIVSAWKLTGMPIRIELLVFKMLD